MLVTVPKLGGLPGHDTEFRNLLVFEMGIHDILVKLSPFKTDDVWIVTGG